MLRCLLSLSLLTALAVPIAAQPAIPADAVGFVHVRAAEIWKHDLFKSVRDLVTAAGPKALAAFEEQMYPNPSDVVDATLVMLPSSGGPDPFEAVGLIQFRTEIDAEKIRKLYLPESATSEVGGRKFYIDRDKDLGLHFPDAKHLLVGPAKSLEMYLTKAPTTDGPLAAALAAAKTKSLTVAVNVKAMPIPPQAYDEIPPEVRPLAMVQIAVLTLDLNAADPQIKLNASYGSDAAAKDAEKALQAAIAMAKQALKEPKAEMEQKLYANAGKGPQPFGLAMEAGAAMLGLGGINRLEAELDRLPITRAGSDLVATANIPKEVMAMSGMNASVMVALLLPAVQKTRAAASGSISANNMKQMGLAFHIAHDATNALPPAAICDKTGKPLLSWRVAILPYIEQENLYQQFKLDEPWDSANNKPLIAKMPKLYVNPRVETKPGMTVYKVFVGKDCMLDWTNSRKMFGVTDGLSNTIMTIEAGDPVIWTKPEELVFDPKKDLPKLALPGGIKQIYVGMGDGSVRRIDLDRVSAKTLKIAIGAADGEVMPPDWDGDVPGRGVGRVPQFVPAAPILPRAQAVPPPPAPPPVRKP